MRSREFAGAVWLEWNESEHVGQEAQLVLAIEAPGIFEEDAGSASAPKGLHGEGGATCNVDARARGRRTLRLTYTSTTQSALPQGAPSATLRGHGRQRPGNRRRARGMRSARHGAPGGGPEDPHDDLGAIGFALLAREPFDVVMTDVLMAEMDGLEVCSRVAGIQPNVPVVIVTGQTNLDTAIGAMRAGAYDFLTKPIDVKLLGLVLARALQHRQLSAEVKRLRAKVEAASMPPGMIGSSPALARVLDTIARIADSDATVLVEGETGTGKELIARRIDDTSARKAGPFVSINCAAVPQNLLESELSSGTHVGHSRMQKRRGWGCSSRPTAAAYSSTKSARCPSTCK